MLKRQIGSTAKPIFEYGVGMETDNWSTYTLFLDDVHSYSNGKICLTGIINIMVY